MQSVFNQKNKGTNFRERKFWSRILSAKEINRCSQDVTKEEKDLGKSQKTYQL